MISVWSLVMKASSMHPKKWTYQLEKWPPLLSKQSFFSMGINESSDKDDIVRVGAIILAFFCSALLLWASGSPLWLVGNQSLGRFAFSIVENNKSNGHSENLTISQEYCDIFKGSWVYDESYNLYSGDQCPYSSSAFNCQKNGRGDFEYSKWRWQPLDCDIPR